MNGCLSQISLSFAEWYQMERLLVAISLFQPGDRHTLRQTEDLNLRIGTATSVTCGCTSRLLMIYSNPTGMCWGELKRKEINMDNKELSDKIIDIVRAIRKIPREQIKNPFEIQVIVVKPKDYGNKERRTT